MALLEPRVGSQGWFPATGHKIHGESGLKWGAYGLCWSDLGEKTRLGRSCAKMECFDVEGLVLETTWRTGWRACATSYHLNEALLVAFDENKDRFFEIEENPMAIGESLGNYWVIRNHVLHMFKGPEFFEAKGHRVDLTIRTRVKSIGSTSMVTEQVANYGVETVALLTSTVVVIHPNGSPKKIPTEIAQKVRDLLDKVDTSPHPLLAQLGDASPNLDTREFPDPSHSSCRNLKETPLEPRESDIDALGHVNNCTMALYLHNLRTSTGRPQHREKGIWFNYAKPLFAGRSYVAKVYDWNNLECIQIQDQSGAVCFQAKSRL